MSISATIKTWQERCEEHPDHGGIVTEQMIRDRMQEEIDALRQAIAAAEKQEPLVNRLDWWALIDENQRLRAQLKFNTAPVHASDISQERVDETAKREHEPVPNDYDRSIHSNPDAQAWAKFFMATVKEKEWCIDDIDEGLMLGWFANAMMAMHDDIKREWVGLTDEEIKALPSWWPSYDKMPTLMTLARDIENTLKEKNI